MTDSLESTWASIAKVTGLDKAQWLDAFAPIADHPHAALATRAHEILAEHSATVESLQDTNLHWWAQGIAIAYEQETGRRQNYQRCDGSYGASASKTIAGELDEVGKAWADYAAQHLPVVMGIPWAGEPRLSSTEKWRYWRCELATGAPVNVNVTTKGPDKVVIAADMRKLTSQEDSVHFKAAWKEILGDFARTR